LCHHVQDSSSKVYPFTVPRGIATLSADADKEASRKGWSERISEVGPAWITAFTGLLAVLAGGGYVIGHASASGAAPDPAPQPTATVTVAPTATVTVTATATVASSATNYTPTSHASQTIASNGSELGTYTVDLPLGYSVPLGASQPTQSQFDISEQNGDLDYGLNGNYKALGNDRMVQLPNYAAPTNQACTSSTAFTSSISGGNLGTAFCILENGKIAGIEVVSQSITTSDYLLKVTVWRNTS
jgi:hypothetical protein